MTQNMPDFYSDPTERGAETIFNQSEKKMYDMLCLTYTVFHNQIQIAMKKLFSTDN